MNRSLTLVCNMLKLASVAPLIATAVYADPTLYVSAPMGATSGMDPAPGEYSVSVETVASAMESIESADTRFGCSGYELTTYYNDSTPPTTVSRNDRSVNVPAPTGNIASNVLVWTGVPTHYKVTVAANVDEYGTVAANPPLPADGFVAIGTSITFTETPAAGKRACGWWDPSAKLYTGSYYLEGVAAKAGNYVKTINAPMALEARFGGTWTWFKSTKGYLDWYTDGNWEFAINKNALTITDIDGTEVTGYTFDARPDVGAGEFDLTDFEKDTGKKVIDVPQKAFNNNGNPTIMRRLAAFIAPDVLRVGDSAFYNVATLRFVNLPKAFDLKDNCFRADPRYEHTATQLERVILSPNVTNFPTRAFYWTKSTTGFTLEPGCFPRCVSMGASAFNDSGVKGDLDFPALTRTADATFGYTRCLKSLKLPKLGEAQQYFIRGDQGSVLESLVLGATNVASSAIYVCNALTNLVLCPPTVPTYGGSFFSASGVSDNLIRCIDYTCPQAPAAFPANACALGYKGFARLYVKGGQDIDGWMNLCTYSSDMVPEQYKTDGNRYPGQRHLLGLCQNGNNGTWIIKGPLDHLVVIFY